MSMLNKGLTVENIAHIRNLKRSTIEDHLVEITFNDKQFDIAPFVPSEMQKMILNIAKQTDSKQLRQIKQLNKWC